MLSKRYKIKLAELHPWCYKEDQSSYLPQKFKLEMDSLFYNIDPIQKTENFFDQIGIPIHDIIDHSDLKYRKEKSAITSMINVDFKNDIRLISSIQHTHDGMYKMMHLGGHASHYKSISENVPYLLKNPNSAIGEGISKYFEHLAFSYEWLSNEIKFNARNQKKYQLICRHMQEVDGLFRCRYMLMLVDFERTIYEDPEQDLDLVWSNLNKKYLGITYPNDKNSCFWATNKYATNLSCSIHNLLLAEIFSAQLHHYITTKVFKNTADISTNKKALGEYLTNKIYKYGDLYPWYELIKKATGEPLQSNYYVYSITGKQ